MLEFGKSLFKVVDGQEPSLYQLFAESKWQVGVSSTALFEGLAFNCNTFVVNLPGVEDMEDLIQEGVVRMVENPDEIVLKYSLSEKDMAQYFSPDWESNLKSGIEFVLDDYNKNRYKSINE